MHNCKTAHPRKSHRRRNRFLRRSLEPLRRQYNWGSAEPGSVFEGPGIFRSNRMTEREEREEAQVAGNSPRIVSYEKKVEIISASMLRRLATVVMRPFVRQAPGR